MYIHSGYNVVTMNAEPSADSLLPLAPAVFHILMALADDDRHGYAIIQEVLSRTDGAPGRCIAPSSACWTTI
jgi:hypothetical protein